MEKDIYSFGPIVDASARVLILGSIPGKVSLEKGQYYAHPQNKFWTLIYSVYNLQPDVDYKDRIFFLRSRNIALWDVIAKCERSGSSDSNIINPVLNNFTALLNQHPNIRYVLFNGNKAAQIFKKNVNNIRNEIRIYLLPSSSPANARMGLNDKLKLWSIIKDLTGN